MKRIAIKTTSRFNKGDFIYPGARPERFIDLDNKKLEALLVDQIKEVDKEIELINSNFLDHPNWLSILKTVHKSKPSRLIIEPNNSRLTNKHLEEFKKNGVTDLRFYLVGHNAKANNDFFGKGFFNKFINNLNLAKKKKLRVLVTFLIAKNNYKDFPRMIDLANKKGITPYFTELMPIGDAKDKKGLILDPNQALEFWENIRAWSENRLELSGHSNLLKNMTSCEYSKIMVINESGYLEKCPLQLYFRSNNKTVNNLKNFSCNECFSWKSISFSQENKKTRKKKVLGFVANAYYKMQNNQGLSKDLLDIELTNKVDAESMNEILDSYNLVKKLKGIKVDWIDNYREIPKEVNLLVNSNSEHKFAFQEKKSPKKEVDFSRTQKVIEELNLKGIKTIILSGYDILIYKDIRKLINLINGLGFQLVLNLNGDSFKKNHNFLLKQDIVFSFDVFGASSYLHDKHVDKESAFDKIIDSMEKLIDKDRSVGLNYILTNKNVEELEQMIDFASMLDLVFLNIIRVNDRFDRVKRSFHPNSSTINKATKLCEDVKKRDLDLRCGLISWKKKGNLIG